MINTLLRLIRPVLDPFLRSPVQSAWTVVFLSLLFFLIFLLILMGIATKQGIANAEKEVDLAFFFVEDASDLNITSTITRLEKLKKDGDIEKYQFFSEEENRENFRQKYPEEFEFIRRHDDLQNTFRASLEVIPKEMNINEIQEYFLSEDFSGIIDAEITKENEKERVRAQKILDILGFLQTGIYALAITFFMGILSILGAFISSSFAMRRKEIFIMRLVGASHSFIRLPFLLEGVSITLLGGALGIGILTFLWYLIVQQVLEIFEIPEAKLDMAEKLNSVIRDFQDMLPLFFGGVILISLAVSFITVEKYLRQKNLLAEE